MDVDMRSESCAELKKVNDAFLALVKQAVDEENGARSTREGKVDSRPEAHRRPALRRDAADVADRPDCERAVVKAFGLTPRYSISSTDSNVPMNMGIPAVTIGRGGPGGRAHAPDEWTDVERKGSVEAIKVAMTIIVSVASLP